ncbi:MAG TPA: nitroreductase family protein [Elusimicrobiota bacterium]|nr:nitroreductase family protein [Elusimicrobiota bacterium]
MTPLVEVDGQKCRGCGLCVRDCPYAALVQESKGKPPRFLEDVGCLRCGHCVSVCPTGALSHAELNAEDFVPVEPSVDDDTMQKFLSSKRSVRHFLSQPVERQALDRLLRVASQAPSDGNSQDREFVILDDKEAIQKIESAVLDGFRAFVALMKTKGMPETSKEMKRSRAILDAFDKGGHPIFRGAPCVVFGCAPQKDVFSWYNVCVAMDYLMLQAHAMGLGSCIVGMCLYDPPRLGKMLNLPEGHQVYSAVVLGWPAFTHRRTVSRKKPLVLK